MKIKLIHTWNDIPVIFTDADIKITKNGFQITKNNNVVFESKNCCKLEISYNQDDFDIVVEEW